MQETSLVLIRTEEDRVAVVDRARAMLAQARSPVDAKKVADLAKAAETYARLQELGEEAISHARAICVDALALMGEMLKAVQKNTGGRPAKTSSRREEVSESPPSLPEQGIPHKQSMHAQSLATVKQTNPELYEKVRKGDISVKAAHVEVKRQEKREELRERAEEVEQREETEPTWGVIRGEVPSALFPWSHGPVRLVFADPPYNIGFDYGEGHDDEQDDEGYLQWVGEWVAACVRILADDGSMWVLINDEYAAEYAILLKEHGLTIRNWVIWYESFGVNCTDKFNRTKRHLFYCVKDSENFVFNFDAVSRPSDRQAKYNDPRANPSGKVLDDVWTDIPRLVGNAQERMPDFPTQLPLALLRRVIGCCTEPGDLVLDPFNGSGTTGAAALALGRRYIGIERSSKFAELSTLRLKGGYS